MALEAVVVPAVGQTGVGVSLSGTGQAVGLEASDAHAVAEVALWVSDLLGRDDPTLHLVEDATMRMVALAEVTTAEALTDWLQGR